MNSPDNWLALLVALAQRIRSAVFPWLNAESARHFAGMAHSGDVTFQLDTIAEQAVASFLSQQQLPLAYYTEDRGLVIGPEPPIYLLIIDPIDGTRPAYSGFEASVVSIALCRYSAQPKFRDISHAVVLELKSGNLFYAEQGQGTVLCSQDPILSVRPTHHCQLDRLRWSFEVVGRPIADIVDRIGPLIDRSSFQGGVYIFNSSAFALTRLVTGQLDAYIDIIGSRVEEVNDLPLAPQRSSQHPVMGLFAYDIAAAYLIVKESQCMISDSNGRSLDDRSLISNDTLSCVAASNLELHQTLIEWLNASDKQR